ncbi:hypothetical protein, partial [Mycolicibacterium elephantis]|uniref:hypothetical protein n=1 Tax=Mycolicibacterium elephantis TaxID=81858 RepID=UPI003A8A0BC9
APRADGRAGAATADALHSLPGPDPVGARRAPLQRGHQSRRRSRTFHRVPHWEHTWIIRPA